MKKANSNFKKLDILNFLINFYLKINSITILILLFKCFSKKKNQKKLIKNKIQKD